jgi:hypothetical protein
MELTDDTVTMNDEKPPWKKRSLPQQTSLDHSLKDLKIRKMGNSKVILP